MVRTRDCVTLKTCILANDAVTHDAFPKRAFVQAPVRRVLSRTRSLPKRHWRHGGLMGGVT
jgi:hypothetical protein